MDRLYNAEAMEVADLYLDDEYHYEIWRQQQQ